MAKRGFGGGMMPGNMNNLLKQAQKMQENMQKMQAELEAKEIEVFCWWRSCYCKS